MTPAVPPALPDIVLDLSRLLSRALHVTPTGVDRVEMAYARGLIATPGERLHFAAVHPFGGFGRLAPAAVRDFLDATERRWEDGSRLSRQQLRNAAGAAMLALRPRRSPPPGGAGRLYVQSSPHHLTRPALVAAILRREHARFVCLVHDLIPLDYPEYARPEGSAEHRVRIETIVGQADGIVANSHATLASLAPWLARSDRTPATVVAHLGTEHPPGGDPLPAVAADRASFVVLSTIEPRKNHLLLLNIWRRLVEQRGRANVPRLVLIGRRGWENEQIVDMLERCPALVGCVEEHAALPDAEVRRIMAGATALLMPSFAEGYGMPVSEALAAGVPVICSDLAALREAGGDAPEFLDPIDAIGWMRMLDAYAAPGSPERAAQVDRIRRWRAPTWADHIAILHDLLSRVGARGLDGDARGG